MSEANCLDPVIRKVDSVAQAERRGEKRVIVNAITRTAVSAGQVRQASALKHFLVSTTASARCQTSVYFGDADGGRTGELCVELNASCAEGREERLAEALCDDPNPGVVFIGKIRGWVSEYIGKRPEAFIGRFFQAKGELQARIAARALAETGLEVTAEVSLCSDDEVTRQLGRSVQTLELENKQNVPSLSSHGSVTAESYEAREEVESHVTGHAAPFIVSSEMQLSVIDRATYLVAGSPPLGAWLKDNFEQVVRQTLGLLELEPIARDITNRMIVKAASIGCEIRQEPFIANGSIENCCNLSASVPCDTGLAGFRVGLRFEAVVVLTQLQGVRHYLERGLDLKTLMEQKALDVMRQTLLTLHPERLYARNVPAGGEESWKILVGHKVREALVQTFDAEIISALVELTETEFDRWFKELRREPINFEVEIALHDPNRAGTLIFHGDCQIEDIASGGWDKVWPAAWDVDRLKRQLSNAVKAGMETRTDLDLACMDGTTSEGVRDAIARLVTDYADDELGLTVKVSNVRRQPTDVEKKVRAAELANQLRRLDLLYKLEERLIQLIANAGSDEEIAQVQKSLTLLRAHRPHDAAASTCAERPDDADIHADKQPTSRQVASPSSIASLQP